MSLHAWAVDRLSIFLGFDSETLETQVMPPLMSYDSPDALSEHLHSMLGTSTETLEFIETFVMRRFPPTAAPEKTSTAATPPRRSNPAPANPSSNEPHIFPSLPAVESSTAQWPNSTTSRKPKKKSAVHPQSTERTDKKPKKKDMTLESALQELDINAPNADKRKPCSCQATKHPLLTVAPNCLHCGKIICIMEGTGPCTFCGTPVLSKEQQQALIAEAKKKRSEQKQLQHNIAQQRRAKAAHTPAVRYASKVSGDLTRDYNYNEAMDEEQRQRAEDHKEKLLEFQRTSAKRSTVIDQASDFTTPTDQLNPWLSPQERALELKKQQANLKRLAPDPTRRRVLTIDIRTKQAIVEQTSDHSESEEESAPVPIQSPQPREDGSAGTFANNPLLKGIHAPQFQGRKKTTSKGQGRRKERVQYDDDLE